LREAVVLSSSNSTLWRAEDNCFVIYVNGEAIQKRVKQIWIDNDLLLFDPVTKRYFLLRDYKNSKDNQLREAEIVNE
jgi:hypothetical protein